MDIRLPDGTVLKNVPEGTTKADIQAKLGGRYGLPALGSEGSPTPAPVAPDRADSGPAGAGSAPPDLAEGMPWYEKVLTGVGGGMRNTYLGAKDLVGLADEADVQERKDWAKNKGDLGWSGTAGEIIGEGVATLPIGMGVGSGLKAGASAAGKVLPGAVAKYLPSGGWRALAGRGAVEGAASNMVVGDPEQSVGERAQSGAEIGGVVGAALPKSIKFIGKLGAATARELGTNDAAVGARGLRALERTLGKDKFAEVVNTVENSTPSQLPRTTAATSGDFRMGALERGARSRGNVDFAPHDEAVSRRAWDLTKSATDSADQLPALKGQASKMYAEGQALLDKIPLSQDRRKAIGQKLLDMRTDQQVIANPNLQREIDNALRVIDNPDAKLGALAELNTVLNETAGESRSIQGLRKYLDDMIDDRTKGQMANIKAGYGVTMDQEKAAEAAARLRGKFVDENGFPSTENYYGQAGQDAVPEVTSGRLRRAVAQESRKGNVDLMPPDKVEELGRLADQLRQHEIYKTPGGSQIDRGSAEGVASTALNAGPFWRLRGALGSVFSGLNEQTMKKVDEALLDPNAFMSMVDAKRARAAALAPWEEKLDSTLRAATRSAAIEDVQGAQ